jgi:hypothetical protein
MQSICKLTFKNTLSNLWKYLDIIENQEGYFDIFLSLDLSLSYIIFLLSRNNDVDEDERPFNITRMYN